ncbi:type 1 glutamine amidotransferase domain-containing protein [Spirosoma arcticum]
MTRIVLIAAAAGLLSLGAIAQPKKVLFLTSAANELPLKNGRLHPTGIFLSEVYIPYKAIVAAGYTVEFATPQGIAASIDPESYKEKYWRGQDSLRQEATDFARQHPAFRHPLPLATALANADQYAGVVIPGGQGLMVDLVRDPAVAQILRTFSGQGKAVGLVCHAPALLLAMPKAQNPFIGYRVSAVTGVEELFIETFVMKGKPHQRHIARQLKKLGLVYEKGGNRKAFALRDRELVTSQNPYSNLTFSKLYVEALGQYATSQNLKVSRQ